MIFLSSIGLCAVSCSEDDFSKDYDIQLPAAIITEVSDEQPVVDKEITLTGEHLGTVSTVSIGAYRFAISSVAEDGKSMVVKVPRIIEAGKMVIYNKYKREFEYDKVITPQFLPVTISEWPADIELGRPFTIKGQNVDLIKSLKLNGTSLSLSGTPSAESASYLTAGLDLRVGDKVELEMTAKVGEGSKSGEIKIVKPKDTYTPKKSIMILNFDDIDIYDKGDASTAFTVTHEKGMFGKALRVKAAEGNGWNGTYVEALNDNGGEGFDLSTYNNPHITMLINTNGEEGYAQPVLVDAVNGLQDRHLTGKFGYGDDYKSKTDGWEWRSYSLEELGFPVVTGKLEKIGVWFRGGNINGTAFDISVDQVMITDGALNPTVLWDCETNVGDFYTLKDAEGSSLDGFCQGNKYASYTGNVTAGWSYLGDNEFNVTGLDAMTYANGVWINFLINTGRNNGYFQLEFQQEGKDGYWMHFVSNMGYGDDYMFAPTDNKWKWRSVYLDQEAIGKDLTKDFLIKLGATTGNISLGVFEINLDYVVFTTVPIDTDLNTDEL